MREYRPEGPGDRGGDASRAFRRRRGVRRVVRNVGARPGSKGAGRSLSFLAMVVVSVVFLLTSSLSASANAIARYSDILPGPQTVGQGEVFKSTRIYDRNGTLLWEIFDPQGGRRNPIHLDQVPPQIILATLAAEDADFYTNPGFEPRAILRAFVQNLTSGNVVSGASTITQQLVRNSMMSPEERVSRSYRRKIKEIFMAWRVTQTYSKDQILEMYLNLVYYGNMSYGIQAAAESYFGKPLQDLTIGEAALLTGLPQAPSAYDPIRNFPAAKERQLYVLSRMVELGFLSLEDAQKAADAEIKVRDARFPIRAPHFVFYVRDLLERKYGRDLLYRGGLTVVTTLDLRLQEMGQRLTQEHVARSGREYAFDNAALVALQPTTGEILSMVGNVDFFNPAVHGEVNVITSLRQPGSSIKPLVYATAFSRVGMTPETIVVDEPVALQTPGGLWAPVNWDFTWRGVMTVRQALAESRNIPAIKTLAQIGIEEFIRQAKVAGLTSFRDDFKYGLSIGIGAAEVYPLELTAAYASFANGGYRVDPVAVLAVYDAHGQLLERYSPRPGPRIWSEKVVTQITSIMSDRVAKTPAFSYVSPLNLEGRMAAVKTGTTDTYKDIWTVGWTPQLVAGVWQGNVDGRPQKKVLSASSAGQLWHNFMEAALSGQPAIPFSPEVTRDWLPVPEKYKQDEAWLLRVQAEQRAATAALIATVRSEVAPIPGGINDPNPPAPAISAPQLEQPAFFPAPAPAPSPPATAPE